MTADRSSLAAIAAFTTTVSRVEANLTLSTNEKAQTILRQLDSALGALERSVSPGRHQAAEHLRALARTSLEALGALHAEVGSAITSLEQDDRPPAALPRRRRERAQVSHPLVTRRERLMYWWDKTISRWWDDDSW